MTAGLQLLRLKGRQPQTDIERWAAKIDDLQHQAAALELDKAAAQKTVTDVLLAGGDGEPEALRVAQLEAKARSLALAIEAAHHGLQAAQDAEKAAQLEAKKANEAKLAGELRAAWIEVGRAAAAEWTATQKVQQLRQAYYENWQGLSGVHDRAHPLGDPAEAVERFFLFAQTLQARLGPDDYAKTGLPNPSTMQLK